MCHMFQVPREVMRIVPSYVVHKTKKEVRVPVVEVRRSTPAFLCSILKPVLTCRTADLDNCCTSGRPDPLPLLSLCLELKQLKADIILCAALSMLNRSRNAVLRAS